MNQSLNMTPEEWLNEQLEKMHISQNEMARRAGISSSSISNFAAGTCGVQVAVDIANFFGVPATVTLALIGKVPPLPQTARTQADLLAFIYTRLDGERQNMLMTYAEYLRAQQSQG